MFDFVLSESHCRPDPLKIETYLREAGGIIPANVNDAAYNRASHDALFAWLKEANPWVAVEVGVHLGGTAWRMAERLRDGAWLCGVDPYPPSYANSDGSCPPDKRFRQMLSNLSAHGVTGRVLVARMTSVAAAEAWRRLGMPPIDFLHVDGDHHYQAVVDDLNAWLPLMRPGARVCGHDWWPKVHPLHAQVQQAVIEALTDGKIRDLNVSPDKCVWAAIRP